MPFPAYRVVVLPDLRVRWASLDGGVWEWIPGERATLIASTPPIVHLEPTRGGWRLDPMDRGRTCQNPRVVLDTGWLLDDSNALVPFRLGPEGQCWSVARGPIWTARCHPEADLVRLVDSGGCRYDLACYYPVAAAWAGPSLVVVTGAGHVVLFRGLVAALNAESTQPSAPIAELA
jgi:hypothetical protein